VLVPVYNDRDTIEHIVEMVHDVPLGPVSKEVICVNECSTDGTGDILTRLHADGRVDRLIHRPVNRGKGAAIRTALAASTGNAVMQDADLEYAKAGARVYEVPISYSGRTYAEGKKIGWKDGVAAMWHIVKYNVFGR
jgi:glycosyltransferase involved in cell wall biosynthesis